MCRSPAAAASGRLLEVQNLRPPRRPSESESAFKQDPQVIPIAVKVSSTNNCANCDEDAVISLSDIRSFVICLLVHQCFCSEVKRCMAASREEGNGPHPIFPIHHCYFEEGDVLAQ